MTKLIFRWREAKLGYPDSSVLSFSSSGDAAQRDTEIGRNRCSRVTHRAAWEAAAHPAQVLLYRNRRWRRERYGDASDFREIDRWTQRDVGGEAEEDGGDASGEVRGGRRGYLGNLGSCHVSSAKGNYGLKGGKKQNLPYLSWSFPVEPVSRKWFYLFLVSSIYDKYSMNKKVIGRCSNERWN